MGFFKFLIVFLLLIVPFSIASNRLGASTNDGGREFCFKKCTDEFTQEDCMFDCKGRGFKYGSCAISSRCCCTE
ncbi:hypothetical protein EJD97_010626 [Solanum chilense]|uniref:Defensin-like domain-containing protein n=1 Tax=Solanum chilense TaxID=4083 RepID=A0A6N2BHB0_SOLCI|nr:hypothetical protein EJD97_010626 [Solanum chilense]